MPLRGRQAAPVAEAMVAVQEVVAMVAAARVAGAKAGLTAEEMVVAAVGISVQLKGDLHRLRGSLRSHTG